MNTSANRNIIFVAIAAVLVAAVTAAIVLFANRGGSEDEPLGDTVNFAREIMTPAPVDSGLVTTAMDNVVATVASAGRARVIVQVEANLSPDASAVDEAAAVAQSQDNVLASTQGSFEVVERMNRLPIMVLEVDEAAARSLAGSPGIVSMMIDRVSEIHVTESIPMVGGPEAYAAGYTGEGFSVAILDSGVEATHSFFGGRVVHDICFSSTYQEEGIFSLCPGGVDFAEGAGASNGCPIGLDGCDHGSHVAGISAGNATGGNGVAPDAGIVAIQVFSRFTGTETCGGSPECILTLSSDQIAAMEWVLENRDRYNIASINMSLGGGSFNDQATCDADDAPYKAVVDRLVAANIAVVSTAGNNGETNAIGSPGCISSIISVGSVTKSGDISEFSNSHAMMDIVAPGSDIISAYKGNRYDTMSGTSMAAPHVAGAFAVLRQAKPSATVSEIFAAMAEGGEQFQDPRNGLVRPLLRLDGALNVLLGGNAPAPTPAPRIDPQPAPSNGPANDSFANARAITNPFFAESIDVTGATIGSEDPSISPTWYCSQGGRFDKSVWYTFTAPSDGYLTISTYGSDYDTIVSVWQGATNNPTQIGCNDDDWWPGNLTTTIAGWVARGTTFSIQVAAWDNGGTLVFSSSFLSSGVSATYTDPNLAPVVFDAALSEAPSDLAVDRPSDNLPVPATCGDKGSRPSDLQGECYTGLPPQR